MTARWTTVAETFDPRANSLNLIRLCLAALVIVSHSGPLTGRTEWTLGDNTLGRWAVVGFFAISGVLITRSRLQRDALSYYWDRLLRIYPGFVVALLFSAFVAAPLSTAFSGLHYRLNEGVRFVVHALPLYAPHVYRSPIPGTDPHVTRFSGLWNGSLYTLFYEGVCYLVIGVLVSVLPRRLLGPLALVAAVALSVASLHYPEGSHGITQYFVVFGAPFAAGAAVWLYRDLIPSSRIAIAAYAVVVAVAVAAGVNVSTLSLLIVPVILWLGAALPLHRVGSVHDISYGIYVYAWPVQTFLVIAWPGILSWPVVLDILLVCAVTAALAFVARIAVEEPALRLRDLPGRRRARRTARIDRTMVGAEGLEPPTSSL